MEFHTKNYSYSHSQKVEDDTNKLLARAKYTKQDVSRWMELDEESKINIDHLVIHQPKVWLELEITNKYATSFFTSWLYGASESGGSLEFMGAKLLQINWSKNPGIPEQDMQVLKEAQKILARISEQ